MGANFSQVSIRGFSSYKQVNNRFIEQVPSHWSILPLFSVTKLKSITNKSNEQLLSVYLDLGVIRFKDVDEKRTNATSLNLSKYQLVEKGDFVLNNQQAWRGSVGVSKYRGIVSPAYIVLSLSEDLDFTFANYLFRNISMVSQYLISSKGVGTIQRNLYYPSLRRVQIALPPLKEQTVIAKFLDDKIVKIDTAIAQKEGLIKLLEESKQIIIQRAVTKGLNPNVSFKYSGVEWIGEIPKHWTKQRLSKYVNYQEGPGIMASDFVDDGIPLIRISGVKNSVVTLNGCNFLSPLKVKRKWEHFKLRKGDLVISGSASTELISEVDEISEGCILYTGLIRLNIKSTSISKEYLKIFLGSNLFFTQINLQKTGSTISHYGPSHLSNMFLILPPIEEQQQIISHFNTIFRKIDDLISLNENQVEKLKEYKVNLIDSAVTGKIKVS